MQQGITSQLLPRESVSTITSKGQVTIPVAIRKYLGVKTASKVAFVIEKTGLVRLKTAHYPTIASLAGAAGSLPKPISWRKTREIARQDALEKKKR